MEPVDVLTPAGLAAALRQAGCVYAEEEAAIMIEAAAGPGPAAVQGCDSLLAHMLEQRRAGIPLEHIVGWAEFCGLRIRVAPGVFVPRKRSEFLVQQALEALALGGPGRADRPLVLDLCCGSGAIGAALAQALKGFPLPEARGRTGFLPAMELHAADIDPAAVACASVNLAAHGGCVHCGDLFRALPKQLEGRIRLIVANAPYVPTADIRFMPPEARLHEPDAALNGGGDGLWLHRRIAGEAPHWLEPGGRLLLESSARQAPHSAAILAGCGFRPTVHTNRDVGGTVVAGILADR
ncbi:release factor glutamine methyltransferase [Arthrobacter stackebrandtii]|uniref:Release factor glutamine methyltransferase n=1 Tax=Arthrobacter stackebrandtii TaxID=272161 RepID=A0ABS4Z061_9MICC|nr:putative protein N(5)-glutamine methyltransferase [Arthrobacter stackebrandtii]MBP2414180.1 release factor glutamine methyltransferase [Arthrobacter stackebrandtii]PYG98953.1 putative protein N(5)-glutamine methyltransferase [Arthrobacter stackebrandtii]